MFVISEVTNQKLVLFNRIFCLTKIKCSQMMQKVPMTKTSQQNTLTSPLVIVSRKMCVDWFSLTLLNN